MRKDHENAWFTPYKPRMNGVHNDIARPDAGIQATREDIPQLSEGTPQLSNDITHLGQDLTSADDDKVIAQVLQLSLADYKMSVAVDQQEMLTKFEMMQKDAIYAFEVATQ
jgi:hypothetical protein